MRIRIDEIPDSGKFIHLHWDESKISSFLPPDDPFELHLLRPVNVDLEVHKRADHVRVKGRIVGVLQVACHRCLSPFELPVDENVDVFLVQPPSAESDEEEVELDKEDLEYEYFDGEVIDIDHMVAEQIFLSLPFKVLCSENCRGICPGCGANLNIEQCRCGAGENRSPFAELAKLKGTLPEDPESSS